MRKMKPLLSNLWYKLLFVTFIFIAALPLKGQSQSTISIASISKDSATNWHTLKQINGITLSYQFIECEFSESIFFKLSNSGTSNVEVALEFARYQGTIEVESNPDDMKMKILVGANSQVFRTCLDGPSKLGFLVRETGGVSNYSTLKLVNISTTQTN